MINTKSKDIINIKNDCIKIAKMLFDRNKVSGSSANLSARFEDLIIITSSGSSFGSLNHGSFSIIDLYGNLIEGPKPSKEYPLHTSFYQKDSNIGAVLHTHSFYSVLWSCLDNININDAVPKYTPYLEMKLGKVGLVDYAPPGTKELFSLFEQRVNCADGFLLKNHGPVVPGKNIIDAFNILEELEESCKIAWFIATTKGQNVKIKTID